MLTTFVLDLSNLFPIVCLVFLLLPEENHRLTNKGPAKETK